MDLADKVMVLVDSIVTNEDEFGPARGLLALSREDIATALRSGEDPRQLVQRADLGGDAFGLAEATQVFTFITVAWKTYEVVKAALAELRRAREALRAPNPAAEHLWIEELEQANVPRPLAEKIARRYSREFAKLLSDSD